MTQTDQHLALVERWAELFNTDVAAMATELYSPECLFSGRTMPTDKLIRFEQKVLAAAPQRSIRIDHKHASGDVVSVEGTLLDPGQGDDWNLGFCAVLTFSNGLIVSDNTYTDYSRWPGMR